jgi:NarL family two-component system sensor histidine kinase LiaS
LDFTVELQSNPIITPLQHIQLQRIIEEAVTNAIKYSKSQRLSISIQSKKTNWTISIQDFGIGFELLTQQHATQYGLKHISERAKLIQSELELISKPDFGTLIRLTIPIL